jgi:hypothetical protein
MLYYHTEAQRQFARERVEQLARDMRRLPASATSYSGRQRRRRGTWRIVDLLPSAWWARKRRIRAHAYHG